MKFHVVQVNEKIKDIARKYDVSLDEIIKLNRHINHIDQIVPGMKIRLPVLSDAVSDEIKDNFLDIEKYYPKVEDFKEVNIEKKEDPIDTETVETEEQVNDIEDTDQEIKNEYYQNQPYPYYQQVNPYYQQQQFYQPYQQVQYPQQQFYTQPQYPQNVYQPPQYNYPQQSAYQAPQNYYEQNSFQREDTIPKPSEDLTLPQYKEAKRVSPKFFEQPAFCDPVLLEGYEKKRSDNQYGAYPKFFDKPLFNPPYPCNEPLEDTEKEKEKAVEIPVKLKGDIEKAELGFGEDVKEIKHDLRDFVRQHTKIKKKKDPLDPL